MQPIILRSAGRASVSKLMRHPPGGPARAHTGTEDGRPPSASRSANPKTNEPPGPVSSREDGKAGHTDTVTGVFVRHQDRINKLLKEEAAKKGEEPALSPRFASTISDTLATLPIANGVNPKVVSERIGHASVAFTLTVYAHVLPGLQKEAASRLAGVVDG